MKTIDEQEKENKEEIQYENKVTIIENRPIEWIYNISIKKVSRQVYYQKVLQLWIRKILKFEKEKIVN
ncbi:hypothetical protein HYE18_00850 [Mycoplasmopsis bovis]|nr:hypothetical protein [Mycoplasmopsis bovis]QQH24997.1 hypothetical protein HYE18_00850 [Mycoplasmopsis bovis]